LVIATSCDTRPHWLSLGVNYSYAHWIAGSVIGMPSVARPRVPPKQSMTTVSQDQAQGIFDFFGSGPLTIFLKGQQCTHCVASQRTLVPWRATKTIWASLRDQALLLTSSPHQVHFLTFCCCFHHEAHSATH